jgi:hypothetical protein
MGHHQNLSGRRTAAFAAAARRTLRRRVQGRKLLRVFSVAWLPRAGQEDGPTR